MDSLLDLVESMPRRRRLLVYEFTPKKDDAYESRVPAEFLNMSNAGFVTAHETPEEDRTGVGWYQVRTEDAQKDI